MLGRTHAITGAAAGLVVAAATGNVEHTPVVAYGVAAFCALLPDLDQHKSIASRYAINKPAHAFLRHLRHRRFTHSILGTAMFALLVLALTNLANSLLPDGLSSTLGLAAVAGWTSHLVADAFNKQGIHLFYPFTFGRGKNRLEWISVPLPRALRISTITDPKGLPITIGRLQARLNTEKFFFRYPVYLLIVYLAWHQLDPLVVSLRHDVWGFTQAVPEPLDRFLTDILS